MRILQEHFVVLRGQAITSYTLMNDNGMEVTCLDYGCIITKVLVPDHKGRIEKVAAEFDSIADYTEPSPVLRSAERHTNNAKFTIDEKNDRFSEKNNSNHLLRSLKDFDKVIWGAKIIKNQKEAVLRFSYLSMDGEEGYPENLSMEVIYKLTNQNELILCLEIKRLPDAINHSKIEEKYYSEIKMLSPFNGQQELH
ncbi:aldose epimerase family protein [Niallia nealsonii]|uniref:Uncharacterized protein n=1 Tax=Niallia nealsonii TaxID=115979 RepID=A0A2N0Z2M7_9BACI|nr:hypothetical protein [Niallia nealsonii]PKG23747.1 hypothetical protein CWS01_10430 [Niallia nealsonii]